MAITLDPVTSLLIGAVIVVIVAVAAWLLNRHSAATVAATKPEHLAPMAHCPACEQEVEAQATRCDSCGAFFEPGKFDCPSCKVEVEYGTEVCHSCGEHFSYGARYLCPACSEPVPKETRHCPHCDQQI